MGPERGKLREETGERYKHQWGKVRQRCAEARGNSAPLPDVVHSPRILTVPTRVPGHQRLNPVLCLNATHWLGKWAPAWIQFYYYMYCMFSLWTTSTYKVYALSAHSLSFSGIRVSIFNKSAGESYSKIPRARKQKKVFPEKKVLSQRLKTVLAQRSLQRPEFWTVTSSGFATL